MMQHETGLRRVFEVATSASSSRQVYIILAVSRRRR
eukprot:CAMPEP_0171078766 /NCGR_PEP_ID=MMETSP0766_2-20121228/14838_1 /TAXON_ID=439317 /ORGANISM="Gambierdiscus australes, Strain CAWD 149" /LENGTH=35 /DNA_ID= /DNA_START= /DNA_END= /DNA_ORIENTATION=